MIGPENKAHGVDKECCWHGGRTRFVMIDITHEEIHNIRVQITKSIHDYINDGKETKGIS
jgi:hypothetical protein